jgi:L-seryl-tRNA(Ser) seleniumtransferase
MEKENQTAICLRHLPGVDELLRTSYVANLLREYPRAIVVRAARTALEKQRTALLSTESMDIEALSESSLRSYFLQHLSQEVGRLVWQQTRSNLKKVINATGIILHTNLGRAPLSKAAQKAVQAAGSGYCNLELDLNTGRRGSRGDLIEGLLTSLVPVEAALVVNNNAAAVLLALNTMARSKEVIVSRGQLVEIGGSFRMPEVMRQSGARLVEVGATNRTYLDDYRAAITEQTALLLHVHTSNYKIIGFTQETSLEELVSLGREYHLPVMSDLGSGCFVDLTFLGLNTEISVSKVVAAGVDVITFSGDKLLGGPQAGIILGKRDYLVKMKKNPLFRAVRCDKLTLAALESTLRLYFDLPEAWKEIPVLRMLRLKKEEIEEGAKKVVDALKPVLKDYARISLEPTYAQVGGGAMPATNIPSVAVVIQPFHQKVTEVAARLRNKEPAIIGRLQEESLWLDLRTVQKEETELLIEALKELKNENGKF